MIIDYPFFIFSLGVPGKSIDHYKFIISRWMRRETQFSGELNFKKKKINFCQMIKEILIFVIGSMLNGPDRSDFNKCLLLANWDHIPWRMGLEVLKDRINGQFVCLSTFLLSCKFLVTCKRIFRSNSCRKKGESVPVPLVFYLTDESSYEYSRLSFTSKMSQHFFFFQFQFYWLSTTFIFIRKST